MSRHLIKLPGGEWEFDDNNLLGAPGGFGEVFCGLGISGQVAVKRLKLSAGQAAYRELKIGEQLRGRSLAHVVPILDAGQDAQSDRYFLVMPICDASLQDEIDRSNGGLDVGQVGSIVRAIIRGLLEVNDITHRDLKPSNILRHGGTWKIADFGIAKFVEDSTSLETIRGSLTPLYAAPEQWRGDRPTAATDIYALGCIVHAMCDGAPPFCGSLDEVREGHLRAVPPTIAKLPPRVANFVSHMLRKSAETRPTLKRCENVFLSVEFEKKELPSVRRQLLEAAKIVAEKEAEEEIRVANETAQKVRRESLFVEALRELTEIKDRLFLDIREHSESANAAVNELKFGYATLRFKFPVERLQEIYQQHSAVQSNDWDVLCWSAIGVQVGSGYVWSASLLFADKGDGNGFRWYEVAFWSIAPSRYVPFALDGHSKDLHYALGRVVHMVSTAYGPFPIDGEDEPSFVERWMGLVAKAATGQLSQPSSFPITDFD